MEVKVWSSDLSVLYRSGLCAFYMSEKCVITMKSTDTINPLDTYVQHSLKSVTAKCGSGNRIQP